MEQRKALGKWFREKFGSDKDDGSNAYPYFIGVFDTVASVATLDALLLVTGGIIRLVLALGGIVGFLIEDYLYAYELLFVIVSLGTLAVLAFMNVRYAVCLPGYPFWKTLHFTDVRLRFYDQELHPNVGYTRHAIAVDENRYSFQRVPWGSPKDWRNTGKGNPSWFKQLWFPGNHSDIGGSYPENELRLSDIALKWMMEEAQAVPDGIKIDRSVLRPNPDPLGPLHDETRSSIFHFARKKFREPVPGATLHPAVLERITAPRVLQYNEFALYRPEALRNQPQLAPYYEPRNEAAKTV